jgi:hypothetical protein
MATLYAIWFGGNMPIDVNGKIYSLYSFNKEDEFEKTVMSLSDKIFGEQTIYIDIKKKVKGNEITTIPDGYVIDMTTPDDPHLYVVENEIVSHDPFKHIGIQMLKFVTSFEEDKTSVRNYIMEHISNNKTLLNRLEKNSQHSGSRNVDNYLDKAVYQDFCGLVVIDEARPELHKVLTRINANISVLELRAYIDNEHNFIYQYDTLYEEDEEIFDRDNNTEKVDNSIRQKRRARKAKSDTIIVPAKEEGFKKEFLGNNQWYAIRISAAMKERIKYIAAYQVSPISAVTHIAEIAEIKPYQDSGKYLVLFKGKASEIGPIMTKTSSNCPQSPVYVHHTDLLNAKYLEDALKV